MTNSDDKVIKEFGDEWTKFNYNDVDWHKLEDNFNQYFDIFPWDLLTKNSVGFDMGCGSGRWARFVAPKVGTLNCIEPSDAIDIAKFNLREHSNVIFFKETTENCSLDSCTHDFGYCLGVLHHIPNTQVALNDCIRLLKPGAPFLLYLYYNFENKPKWFWAIWKLSDNIRKVISRSPRSVKYFLSSIIAFFLYIPLSRTSLLLEHFGFNVDNIPLSDYRDKPYYQCKNDALDRFGTRLEQRFSKMEIKDMLSQAGCENIIFSPNTPYWCCLSFKKNDQ